MTAAFEEGAANILSILLLVGEDGWVGWWVLTERNPCWTWRLHFALLPSSSSSLPPIPKSGGRGRRGGVEEERAFFFKGLFFLSVGNGTVGRRAVKETSSPWKREREVEEGSNFLRWRKKDGNGGEKKKKKKKKAEERRHEKLELVRHTALGTSTFF